MMENNLFLENIVIDQFRTISKLKFSPNKDLNIIIGENGTGKSNLLAAIKKALNFDLDGPTENKFSFDIRDEKRDLFGFSMQSKFIRKDNSQYKEKKFGVNKNNELKKEFKYEGELSAFKWHLDLLYNLISIKLASIKKPQIA